MLSSGRWSATADFRDAGIVGVERLFTRLWRLARGEAAGPGAGDGAGDGALASGAARVAAGIETMRFNVAIGALRELANRASPAEMPTLALLLAPFAPYLAEELWAVMGGPYSVHAQGWPAGPATAPAGPKEVELVVQVDGRVRDRLSVPAGLETGAARQRAEAAPNVARHIAGRPVFKCIYVPDRLINLVTSGP